MPHNFAVMADPHYWNLFPDYPLPGVPLGGRSGAMVHTLADSARSTRLFNEGYFALPTALDRCVAEGIRTVVIPGDLSDDGQISAMAAAVALLEDYRARHGMRFFLCPGNHDAHSMAGRHISRRMIGHDGGAVTVTSDPKLAVAGPSLVEPRQRCQTYPELLAMWARLGLRRDPGDLHWETPFGTDDRAEARMFDIASADGQWVHRQLDLSYLVEPEPGLWLLSIDANIYVPVPGFSDNLSPAAFEDSTAAGWNRLVEHKPFLIDWMGDVAMRAKRLGKALIAFSHYPVTDVFGGAMAHEQALAGNTMSVRRTPRPETVAAVCATGIGTHFSGHMHVLNRTEVESGGQRLVNYALPSLQAFPAAWARVEATPRDISVSLVPLDVPSFRALVPAYGIEADRNGLHRDWLKAFDYTDHLFRQLREQVEHRLVPEEWPEAVGRELTALDLSALIPADLSQGGADRNIFDLLADVQALRMGGPAALDVIPAIRMRAWRAMAEGCRAPTKMAVGAGGPALQRIMAMFDCFDHTARAGLAYWPQRSPVPE